jgi:plastocyanin
VRTVSFTGAVCLTLWTLAVSLESQTKPRTHTVTIEAMRFQPEVLSVASGDTIVWVNKDLVPHTATSVAGSFDSKDIQADKSWSYTSRTKGDFAYTCTFHPAMKATLRVN